MKRALNIFAIFFSALIIFSCEPRTDENGDYLIGVNQIPGSNGGGGTTGTLKLLKKTTALNSDGTKTTFTYNYTGKVLTSAEFNDDGVKTDFILSYKDSKISQYVMIQTDGSTTMKTTMNLNYVGGKLTTASGNVEAAGEELNKNTTSFTYNTSGKLQKILSSLTAPDPETPGTFIEIFTYQSDVAFSGNNVSTWKLTIKAITPPPITISPIVLDAGFSNFDSKKNPLQTLPEEFTLIGAHFLTGTNSVIGLSANNYGTTTLKTNAETQTSSFTYVYDESGYPISGKSAQGTVTFEYQ